MKKHKYIVHIRDVEYTETENAELRAQLSRSPAGEPTPESSAEGALQNLQRYDYSADGMVETARGHYVEWMRLPWAIIATLNRAASLDPGTPPPTTETPE